MRVTDDFELYREPEYYKAINWLDWMAGKRFEKVAAHG